MSISKEVLEAAREHESIDRQISGIESLISDLEHPQENPVGEDLPRLLGRSLLESVAPGIIDLFRAEIQNLRDQQAAL